MGEKKRIVVIGAGFGGLAAARHLARGLLRHNLHGEYEIALIDRNDHHTYTPLLYEIATTSKQTANMCRLHKLSVYGIKELVADLPINFIKSEVEKIDLNQGIINLADGQTLKTNYFILSPGSEPNYFGINGLKQNSFPFKSFYDAVRLRDKLIGLASEVRGEINILVAGAGPTGIELASEIKTWCPKLKREFPDCNIRVRVIEAARQILPDFEERVRIEVENRLRTIGVEITTGETIAEVKTKTILAQSGKQIPFDVLIWTGGVQAPDLVARLPVKTDERGRAEISAEMMCIPEQLNLEFAPRVYIIGDAVCVLDPKTQKPMPGVARAAILQGKIAAHNILEQIKKSEFPTYHLSPITYSPINYPYIIPVGGKYAVAKIGPFVISGFAGWVLKGLVELNYLASIMPLGETFKIWFRGLWTFTRNERLG